MTATQTQTNSEVTECVMVHDTIVTTLPDSATFWALVECDSLGQALLRQINTQQGERTHIAPTLKKTTDGQTLVELRALSTPENVIVRQVQTTIRTERTSTADTQKTAPRERTSGLKTAAHNVLFFLLGFMLGLTVSLLKWAFK